MEICIVVEITQDIGAVELLTVLYIHPKYFVFSFSIARPRRYFQ